MPTRTGKSCSTMLDPTTYYILIYNDQGARQERSAGPRITSHCPALPADPGGAELGYLFASPSSGARASLRPAWCIRVCHLAQSLLLQYHRHLCIACTTAGISSTLLVRPLCSPSFTLLARLTLVPPGATVQVLSKGPPPPGSPLIVCGVYARQLDFEDV